MAYVKPLAKVILFDNSDVIVTSAGDLGGEPSTACLVGLNSGCSRQGDSDLPCTGFTLEGNIVCYILTQGKVNSVDPNPPSDM